MIGRDGPAEESLMGHLLELRARLMRGIAAVLVVFLALMPFASELYTQFAQPLVDLRVTQPIGHCLYLPKNVGARRRVCLLLTPGS